MNIVRGVADLLRRSSYGQSGGDGVSWGSGWKNAPYPRICFKDTGEEAELGTLWSRYENAIDKVEKRKLLHTFLQKFIQTYKNWEPLQNEGITAQEPSSLESFLLGCSLGHPSEVILILIQEITRITSIITELNDNDTLINAQRSDSSLNLIFTTEDLLVLKCLMITSRSKHNCKVFGYYGGVQKITALMKAAVVKLKTSISAFSVDEELPLYCIDRIRSLQKIMVYVISIISCFITCHTAYVNARYLDASESLFAEDDAIEISFRSFKPFSEAILQWQQKAIVLVIEAGGINWLVELLRVIRRLNLKEQWTDLTLQYLTLGTIRYTLSENPRAQTHFRSIGGLEVLLDGLGLPSSKHSVSTSALTSRGESSMNQMFGIFKLQILSLDVLRDSTYGNVSNLQYLCENGRIHKLANSICWPTFMFHEFLRQQMDLLVPVSKMMDSETVQNNTKNLFSQGSSASAGTASCLSEWKDYTMKLSRGLCSFLIHVEDSEYHHNQAIISQNSVPISVAYWELSIRWFLKVLIVVFPCIKACSPNGISNHIRTLANTLQHHILYSFRQLLVSSPALLEVFRHEGIWELIFSDNFFYFDLPMQDFALEPTMNSEVIGNHALLVSFETCMDLAKSNEADVAQDEAISFVEFAASLRVNDNNMTECCVLVDTLEQCACSPVIACTLIASLHRILQLRPEQSVASFKSLDAVARILKVCCIQGQELKKLNLNLSDNLDKEVDEPTSFSEQLAGKYVSCLNLSMMLFDDYISLDVDGRRSVLYSSHCIECLFDLFWVESLREVVMLHILGLLKLPQKSSEDHVANLFICTKFLETFTRVKDREMNFAELSNELLSILRDILTIDQMYFQKLFRDGHCFLHLVSLLNGLTKEKEGEKLVLNVLQTLTLLLTGNEDSKFSLRALVGSGYHTLQNLLLDFYKGQPTEELLHAILDMLVDGKFNINKSTIIKNEDVVVLLANILQKSSAFLQHYVFDILFKLLKDSIANRTSCSRSGLLSLLLDWFSQEKSNDMISKIAGLIQIIGGHSISGKDLRKLFVILREENTRRQWERGSLLLGSIRHMLKERGPVAFFEFSGCDSGIKIKTPIQWPNNKGFSFTCWFRVEDFPEDRRMGLFFFLTDNGRGCAAVLGKDKLIFETMYQKRQCVSLPINLLPGKWHFLSITHSIGRAFSGGSMLRCYVDGNLISSEKCHYVKVTEAVTCCEIGTEIPLRNSESLAFSEKSSPFLGQIGPIYMFNDSLSFEQINSVYQLGPSYMYLFFSDELFLSSAPSLHRSVLDGKDGLSSKILFGINAQASSGKTLFNVSSMLRMSPDENVIEATVMKGTQLCTRHLLQDIINCVGGISVFFPLLIHNDEVEECREIKGLTSTDSDIATQVIELIASVLDENLANQQQMDHLSGFSILGFLIQSVPRKEFNTNILSSMKYLFNVLRSCSLSELLLKEAILKIYLNPRIWLRANYNVQRDIIMYLIQYFEADKSLLPVLFGLPWILDMVRQFYWELEDNRSFVNAQNMHVTTKDGEKPGKEEVQKIRLLLISLGEFSLRQKVSTSDVKALIAFFETAEDVVCVGDVLHMVIRALSQKSLLASFLEQLNLLGGCQMFLNLLLRDLEPIRLLGLQFLGKLLVGLPSERKEPRFFSIPVGRSKSLSESHKKGEALRFQPIFDAISERLLKFPLSDHLCAALFDILLGGASPKQVLQRNIQSERQKNITSPVFSCHFVVPQVLVCVFKVLAKIPDTLTREKILSDLLDLLYSNPSNIEAFVDYAWNSWLVTSLKLLKDHELELKGGSCSNVNYPTLIRNLFCIVLSHYICFVKGGWHQLEGTINFALLMFEKDELAYPNLLRDIFEDLIGFLVEMSSNENIFASQPCLDNSLHLLKLIDEMLIGAMGGTLMFSGSCTVSVVLSDGPQPDGQKDISLAINDILNEDSLDQSPRNLWNTSCMPQNNILDDGFWNLYDKLWILINEMDGKGTSKLTAKRITSGQPSFGQRARGLVQSWNIPAAEMAAVVVSGGLTNALGGKTNKHVDKAMVLRGEFQTRIVFHLVFLYIQKATLERVSKCVQQFILLLPSFTAFDDEQSKNRLHFFIWFLLTTRRLYGVQDDGARFHIITHLVLEMVNCWKSLLATSLLGREDALEAESNAKEAGFIMNLIQMDWVLSAASEEVKYIKSTEVERMKQLRELDTKLEDCSQEELQLRKLFEDDILSNVNTIVSSDDHRRAAAQLSHEEELQVISEKWVHIFRALSDERGLWSTHPFPNNILTRWKLDKTEDSWRRRPKLKRNYNFDERLCHLPSIISDSDSGCAKIVSCAGRTNSVPEETKLLLKGVKRITEDAALEPNDSQDDFLGAKDSSFGIPKAASLPKFVKDMTEQVETVRVKKNVSSSDENESSEVQLSIPCMFITPKRKLAGYLTVMQYILHFSCEFLVEGTGGSSVFRNFDNLRTTMPSEHNQVEASDKRKLPNVSGDADKCNAPSVDRNKIKRHRRWKLSKIKAVHLIRYLLQYTAIEIFFIDSVAPVFLNFASQRDAKHVGALVVSLRNESLFPKGSLKDKNGIISFVDRHAAFEMAEVSRERWRRREISNFEYLMTLNTLSGRTYNDLTQYPVFPWLLTDYSSERLDINKSSTFRDLSKPVGALDSKRFQVFEDRYRNFSDPDIPNFYYGSHYSSMGIVLFYLLRLEPFTTLHRSLQGGKFDHADRLFQSIEGTFRNCLSNTSDVKELIPEFFYMPEFLVNSNSYHLGIKQDGEPLTDVVLPPWANGSPEEFIYQHREALESEYVSSNLHSWIDLVFGYKQRGKPAVEAANIFYYLTYEGAVDLESMEDLLQRSAIEDQIANFGQTPIQLFRKKHPRRGPPIPIARPLYFAPASITLTSTVINAANPPAAVVFIGHIDSNIVVVSEGLTISVKIWLTTQLQSGGNFTFSGSQDPSFGIGSDILTTRKIGALLSENIELETQCFATLQTPNENYLILCGNWDNSFQVISLDDGRLVQSIRQHKDVVSCVAVTSDGSVIATGSYDTTIMLWYTSRWKYSDKKLKSTPPDFNRKDHIIIENPFHILCGHYDVVTCLSISVELDIVISGSKDGTCIFHTLREGRYVRSIQHPSNCVLSKLVLSRHGRLVFYSNHDLSLHQFDVNGKHIASSESNGRLSCIELSFCGDFLVCAVDHGQIVLRSMHYLEIVKRYEGTGKIITSLIVTPEECFLAGTRDGSILVYSTENPQIRKTNLPKNAKAKTSSAAAG